MNKPRIKCHRNGRISFPGIVKYVVRLGNGRTNTLPYPPTYETHPAPTLPPPLSSYNSARMIALGEIKPIPSSLPYLVVVLDLPAYERLASSGLLRDPRHAGIKPTMIDVRKTA